MLSMQDVLDYCDLDCGEIEAVAEHEHIPIMVAAELGETLLSSPGGVFRLSKTCSMHWILASSNTSVILPKPTSICSGPIRCLVERRF